MARHRRRHRRHLGRRRHGMRGLMTDVFGGHSETHALVAGAVAGVAVTAGLKFLFSQSDAIKNAVPDVVQNNMILVGSLLAGGAIYYARKRASPSMAKANLTGALLAGGVSWGWSALQSAAPNYFGDIVTLSLPGRQMKAMRGILTRSPDRRFGGYGFNGTMLADPRHGAAVRDFAESANLAESDGPNDDPFDAFGT